jgi:hypothetical protein
VTMNLTVVVTTLFLTPRPLYPSVMLNLTLPSIALPSPTQRSTAIRNMTTARAPSVSQLKTAVSVLSLITVVQISVCSLI